MAACALFAFAVVSLSEAVHVAHDVNDALLNYGQIFRRPVPVGTLIASALFAALLGGLIWFHADRLETFWNRVSRWPNIPLPVLRYVAGAVCLAGLPAIALQLTSDVKQQQISQPAPTLRQDPPTVDQVPDEAAPPTTPTQQSRQPMQDRMAGRHVCDLFEDPTDAEWNACLLYNQNHPGLRGTGGPTCIMVNGQIKCLTEPAPIRRPRPPLNLLPNLR